MKKVFSAIKKIILSAFILYGFNLIASPLNIIVPINVVTVLVIALLGMPGLFGLVFSLVLLF